MKNEVMKSNAEVLLTEAMGVLKALESYGLLTRSGTECDSLLPIALDRGRALLSNPTVADSIDYGPARAFDAPYQDGEVLGLDNDGQVICWDESKQLEYASGEKLDAYGLANLKLHELPRVKVSVESWLLATAALQGDRDRQESWSRIVFVNANDTSEFGGNGPAYAKLVVDAAFIARLLRLSNLCKKERLSEIRVSDEPAMWGGCDEDSLRLTCGELVVCGSSFWFVDSPKHTNITIQTDATEIGVLIEAAMTGEGDVFLASDPKELRRLVDEDLTDDDDPTGLSDDGFSGTARDEATAL